MATACTLAVVLALSLAGAGAAPAAGSQTGRNLDRTLDRVMDKPGAPPGLSVLTQRKGKTEFRRRGVADVDTGAPFTRGKHYRIASMSKAFNGALALALADRGDVSLGDTVGERLPGVLPLAEGVTIAEALQHTGGIPDYIRSEEFLEVFLSDPTQYLSPLELLAFVEDTEPAFDPGEEYEYSDSDNIAVGLIAEGVAAEPYDDLLRRLIYEPLGMNDTTLPDDVAMPRPFIHGYEPGEYAEGELEDVSKSINPALAWASGGMVSTADDVNRFFRLLMRGRLFGKDIARAQRDWVEGSSSPPGPGDNESGLGLFRYSTECGRMFGHTGSFPGYRLFAAASRDGTRSVVFTVNRQIVPGSGSQKVSRLIRKAQEKAVCHVRR